MKYLVFGDTHGREQWKSIIEAETFDKVIFLGDYVTSREKISEAQQINNLKDILEYKRQNYDKVVLLRGNHDMEALKYSWAECSPRFYSNYLYEIRNEFLKLTQWLYKDNDIVFSHAGISNTWWNNVKTATNIKDIEDINTLEPSELFGFTPCKMSDYYGASVTQPLTWIRPEALAYDTIKGMTNIVGHTRTLSGRPEKFKDVYMIDCMPNYIVVEDGIVEYKEFDLL